MEKYKKQLATYKLALKMVDDDDYNDKRIDKLILFLMIRFMTSVLMRLIARRFLKR